MSLRPLVVTDAVGGVWTYSLELARGLLEQGVEPVLAVIGPSPTAEQRQACEGIELIDTGLPLDWLADGPAAIRMAGRALADLARGEQADLVQLPSAALLADARFDQPVIAVQHSCVASWWSAVREGPLPPDFAWRRDLVDDGLNIASAVVAPTAAFAATTARLYGLGRPVYCVHNGRSPIALPRRSRGRFVFTCGRLWDEGKNLATLDSAAAMLDVRVEAIGPLAGPNGAEISLAHIEAPGELGPDEIAGRLAARAVFASAALYEPFGLSALEAAQAGCPLVLSDITTLRELWDGAAIFAPARDAAGFAEAIAGILGDPERHAMLGAAAQKRALRYTRATMARKMTDLYRMLTSDAVLPEPVMETAGAA